MNIIEASIRLFNTIPEKYLDKSEDIVVFNGIVFPKLKEGNILESSDIENVAYKVFVNLKDIQNTFWKNWKDVKSKSQLELFEEAYKHYFSTYGSEMYGIFDFPPYLPDSKSEPVKYEKMLVLGRISTREIKNKIDSILESGIALSKKSIEDIFTLKEGLGFEFTNKIKNKEVNSIIDYKTGKYSKDGETLIRTMNYAITNNSLLIKSNETYSMWKYNSTSQYINNLLKDTSNIETLSTVFYRYKKLLLALRTTPERKVFINKVRRLANRNWQPKKKTYSIIEKFTKNLISEKDKEEFLKSNTQTLIKVYNKILFEENIKFSRVNESYKIRNGKIWIKSKKEKLKNKALSKLIDYKFDILIEIRKRLDPKENIVVMMPKNMELAIPTTEKSFIGNMPIGSEIRLGEENILGIRWNDEDNGGKRTDLDLSAVDEEGYKIGWNSSYKKDGYMYYSGDMTCVDPKTKTANEYIRFEDESLMTLLIVNSFNGNKLNYDFIVADYEEKIKDSNIIDPNRVVFSTKLDSENTEEVIGLLNENRFIFNRISSLRSNVSSLQLSKEIIFALYKKKYLKISDIFETEHEYIEEKDRDKNKIYIDLTNPSKSDILNLLKAK